METAEKSNLSMDDLCNQLYFHIQKEFITSEIHGGNIIAESFGVQGGFNIKIADIYVPKDFEIIYITGESGSGKTTILKEIAKQYGANLYEIDNHYKTVPLFLANGEENQIETISVLTSVGISDATLWLNTYNELSDSQKARYEIALKMMQDDVVLIDEFLSTLDRDTAKAVAYNIQKAIRKAHKKLIVTTAHEDLQEYLKPDVSIVGKAFPSQFNVIRNEISTDNPILKNIIVQYGTKEDYKKEKLGELHYKGKYTGGTKEYLFAYLNGKTVGVLVAIYNMHTGGRRISRVVVHPSYRGCGIAQTMIKKYIKDFPNTDVVASMALYNPVFEKAGMHREKDVVIVPPKYLKENLKQFNFDEDKWQDKKYLNMFCESQDVREALSEFSKNATHLVCPAGKYLSESEIKSKIKSNSQIASTVLFGLRPRTMAKYVNI